MSFLNQGWVQCVLAMSTIVGFIISVITLCLVDKTKKAVEQTKNIVFFNNSIEELHGKLLRYNKIHLDYCNNKKEIDTAFQANISEIKNILETIYTHAPSSFQIKKEYNKICWYNRVARNDRIGKFLHSLYKDKQFFEVYAITSKVINHSSNYLKNQTLHNL